MNPLTKRCYRESVKQDLRAFLPRIVLALIALVLILRVMGF